MPYRSIEKSVKSLDDVRLNKQILECYQILQVSRGNSHGYENHPIVKHWANIHQVDFLVLYGLNACIEYERRKSTVHKYFEDFHQTFKILGQELSPKKFLYFYAERSKNDPKCVRTYDESEVTDLYKMKLINKWNSDIDKGRYPKWTNSEPPEFFKERKI